MIINVNYDICFRTEVEWQPSGTDIEDGDLGKSATWSPAARDGYSEGSLLRCVSLPNLMSRWTCTYCQTFNNSITQRCVACAQNNMAADTQQPPIAVEETWMSMDKDLKVADQAESGANSDECKECDVTASENRSPKRHSPSVYERVKSKVSRSLSNGGSVIHRRWIESRASSRPSSLIVGSGVGWNINHADNKTLWSCQRCTLLNSVSIERCAVCEMPRKMNLPGGYNTLPRSGIVITVPDWGGGNTTLDFHRNLPIATTAAVATAKGVSGLLAEQTNQISLWSKPKYRRSYSEGLPSDIRVDNKINRRSLVETDAQGNIPLTPLSRQANNLNLQLNAVNRPPSVTRYSYIGISEPSRSQQPLTPAKLNPTPPIVVELAQEKLQIQEPKTGDSFERKWTCIQCSYAYNHIWSDACDICNSARPPPSLTEPSLITVTKDSVRYTPPKTEGSDGKENGPDSHLQQDLEDDFQFLPGEVPESDWTCKKCTLVNVGSAMACVVCGGSKLKSITLVRDMTLRKGEFWTCSQCTLKNPLSLQVCQACKTPNKPKLLEVPTKQAVPRSPSPRHGHKSRSSAVSNPALGAIPKQKQARRNSGPNTPRNSHHARTRPSNYSNGPVTNELAVIPAQIGSRSPSGSWHCIHCTFENRTASPSCEMCQSSRSLGSVSPVPGTPVPSPARAETPPVSTYKSRQESELMEDLRHIEEREALEKWKHIVQYCKEVYFHVISFSKQM